MMISAITPSELIGIRLTDRSRVWEQGNFKIVLWEELPRKKGQKIKVVWRGTKSNKPYFYKEYDNFKNARKRFRQCVTEAKKILAGE